MEKRCECDGNTVPGVLAVPFQLDGRTAHRIERCDDCGRFGGDLEAAAAFAAQEGGEVRYWRVKREDYDDEAQLWDEDRFEEVVYDGTFDDAYFIAPLTDPWVMTV